MSLIRAFYHKLTVSHRQHGDAKILAIPVTNGNLITASSGASKKLKHHTGGFRKQRVDAIVDFRKQRVDAIVDFMLRSTEPDLLTLYVTGLFMQLPTSPRDDNMTGSTQRAN